MTEDMCGPCVRFHIRFNSLMPPTASASLGRTNTDRLIYISYFVENTTYRLQTPVGECSFGILSLFIQIIVRNINTGKNTVSVMLKQVIHAVTTLL
jgi:hypothetical protein